MENAILKLHRVWDQTRKAEEQQELPIPAFEDFTSKIISMGPFYFYVVDFFDMSISNISSSIKEIHGLEPGATTFNDILATIHPEDLEFVAATEKALAGFYFGKLKPEQFLKYKMSYSFRSRMADGSYALLNHQAILLTLHPNGGLGKSLNIHTRIDHIAQTSNYKYSLLGLEGEPSFINLSPHENPVQPNLSRREIEIIRLLADGLDNTAIAAKLFISPLTVKTHRKNILKKTNARNTSQLIKTGILHGLI
ncbi:MAG: response regulator transcription factor [Pseudobacter sp.]|uniref:response regulator transcription factor n=1 Tax=Pseudobacter sp. TaxID=2045420 RepID=UPI003F7E68DC